MCKSRNINGKGTTYKDEARDSWVYQISYTDPETRELKRKKFSAKVKKVAVKKGDEFLSNLEKGLLPSSNEITVGQWVETWLTDYCKQRVRPRTWEKYKSSLECYVLAKFKNTFLRDLRSVDLQKHFNSLLENGRLDGKPLSSSTVRGVRRYFTMCLDSAVKHGMVLKNIARDTEPPKLTKKDIMVLNTEQIEKLLIAAKNIDNNYMQDVLPVVLKLALHTGMRQGEIFGLKWEDIDLAGNYIYIKRSLAYIVGKGYILQEPKTKTSRRKILLMRDDIVMLKEYKKWQEQHIDSVGDKYENASLVFANIYGKPIDTSNFTTRYLKPTLKMAGIDSSFTFHCFRHTHATILLKEKVNPKVIQERLGHSNISMTLDIYSHVLPDMQDEAIGALNNIFGRKE